MIRYAYIQYDTSIIIHNYQNINIRIDGSFVRVNFVGNCYQSYYKVIQNQLHDRINRRECAENWDFKVGHILVFIT